MKQVWYGAVGLLIVGLLGLFFWQQRNQLNQGCPVEPKNNQVQINPSGLQSIILQEANEDAQQAQPGKMVTVHYSGYLFDESAPESKGAKFDSSVDRGQPFQFSLGSGMVIRGWEEGVAQMKVGEKRRLIIPANLGYGERGFPGVIPPNATLVFDVELLRVD